MKDIYIEMKKKHCLVTIPPKEYKCQHQSIKTIKSFIYEPDSRNVYDEFGNYVGGGVYDEEKNTLEVTPMLMKSGEPEVETEPENEIIHPSEEED